MLLVALPATVFVSCSDDDEVSDQDIRDYYADKWVKDDFSQCPMDMAKHVLKGTWHYNSYAYGRPYVKEEQHEIDILDDDVLVTRNSYNEDNRVFDIKKWEIADGKLILTLYPDTTMICDSVKWNDKECYLTCIDAKGNKYEYNKNDWWGIMRRDLTWARYWYNK